MTTHRQAWALRVGMVAALAVGALGLAVPAYAAGVTVGLQDSAFDLQPGGTQQLNVQVTNTGATADTFDVTVALPNTLSGDVTVSRGGCTSGSTSKCTTGTIAPQGNQILQFQLKANQTVTVAAGQTKQGTGTVKATSNSIFTNTDLQPYSITVHGPNPASSPTPATSTVTSIAGVVKDIMTGAPIVGALVELQDGASHTFQQGTDSKGRFTFRSSGNSQIKPGQMVIGASKDGYTAITRPFTATAGQSLTVLPLAMTPANATASPPAAAVPDSLGASPMSTTQTTPLASSGSGGGGSGFSTLLIVLGAILVLAGAGAIVLIMLRRKDDGTGPAKGDGGGDQGPTPVPVPAGMAAYGAGPNDATMVARNPSPDAPTEMLQRTPAVDPFPPPDPYGAPPPQPAYQAGGYGQGYQSVPYDDAPTYHPDQGYRDQPPGYGGGYQTGGYGSSGYGAPYGPEPTMPATSAVPASPPPPPAPPLGHGQGPGSGVPPRPPAPVDPFAAPNRDYPPRGGYPVDQPATRSYPGPSAGSAPLEPTGLYENYEQTYNQPRAGDSPYGGTAPAPGGYPPSGGPAYGSPGPFGGTPPEYGSGRGGYDAGRDYPPAPRAGSGYDQPHGGYEPQPPVQPRGGYDQPAAGYPPVPQPPQYQQSGGYDQPGAYGGGGEYAPPGQSRHSAPPPQPPAYPGTGPGPGPEQRRSLDWLDD